jgi:hypothetical protein
MNVKELIELLQTYPQDALVVQSKDGEGNGFSPVSDLGPGKYIAESTWSGDLINEDDLEEYGADEDSVVDAVCIWPTN